MKSIFISFADPLEPYPSKIASLDQEKLKIQVKVLAEQAKLFVAFRASAVKDVGRGGQEYVNKHG